MVRSPCSGEDDLLRRTHATDELFENLLLLAFQAINEATVHTWFLMDLLQHEMRIFLLVFLERFPLELLDLLLHSTTILAVELVRCRRYDGILVILEEERAGALRRWGCDMAHR